MCSNAYNTIRGAPIRIVCVVIVDIPAVVHIPRIVRVVAIRGTQAHVLVIAYNPFIVTVMQTDNPHSACYLNFSTFVYTPGLRPLIPSRISRVWKKGGISVSQSEPVP